MEDGVALIHCCFSSIMLILSQRYCSVPQLSRQCAEFAASLKELKEHTTALDLLYRAKMYITSSKRDEPATGASTSATSAEDGNRTGGDSDSRQERDSVKLQILFEMGSVSSRRKE